MKIAIHNKVGSFSDRWIQYCEDNDVPYKLVDAYDSNIIEHISDCDAFMWHHSHGDYRDVLFAKQLLNSLEVAGKVVFPDFASGWHFDDKVSQKYLFEAIGAPLVPSYVFYTKKEALSWADQTTFPKVFKLRGGAGASNVKLVKSKSDAIRTINKAFGRGFSQFDRIGYCKDRFNKWNEGRDSFLGVLKGIARLFIETEFSKFHAREKGYAYFQKFIPNNDFDIRVIVIGNKAFAIKRMCRGNDFRASGSGNIIYRREDIDIRCIESTFNLNKKIKSQSLAVDFVFDENNIPLLVEISYGFLYTGYDSCPGYWTEDLVWNETKFNPQYWMVENIIDKLNR